MLFLSTCDKHPAPLSENYLFVMQATSAYNGVGIVKLMGRQSGFIAMHASLASGQVDVCLIPEVIFSPWI
jgi:6-phosphofructokinase